MQLIAGGTFEVSRGEWIEGCRAGVLGWSVSTPILATKPFVPPPQPKVVFRTGLIEEELVDGLRRDVVRDPALVPHAEDYTLMDPLGGEPTRGFDPSSEDREPLERFFEGGEAEVEVVSSGALPRLTPFICQPTDLVERSFALSTARLLGSIPQGMPLFSARTMPIRVARSS